MTELGNLSCFSFLFFHLRITELCGLCGTKGSGNTMLSPLNSFYSLLYYLIPGVELNMKIEENIPLDIQSELLPRDFCGR